MVATSDAVARARYVSLLTPAAIVAFAANSVLCRVALGGGEIDAASFSAIRLLSAALALAPTERCSGCSGPEAALRHMSIALPTASILTMPVTGRSRTNLEVGGALPDIAYPHQVDAALRQVGFELLEARDLSENPGPGIPWHQPLVGSRSSLAGFRSSQAGHMATQFARAPFPAHAGKPPRPYVPNERLRYGSRLSEAAGSPRRGRGEGAQEAHADEPLQRPAANGSPMRTRLLTRLWLPRTVGRRTSPTTRSSASCWR